MRLEQKLIYKQKYEDANYYYKNTKMNIAQISRLLRISETKCGRFIDPNKKHKLAKWFQKRLKDMEVNND